MAAIYAILAFAPWWLCCRRTRTFASFACKATTYRQSFATQLLLPALQANTSLREIRADDSPSDESVPDFDEEAQLVLHVAQEFVEQRETARVAAEAAARCTAWAGDAAAN